MRGNHVDWYLVAKTEKKKTGADVHPVVTLVQKMHSWNEFVRRGLESGNDQYVEYYLFAIDRGNTAMRKYTRGVDIKTCLVALDEDLKDHPMHEIISNRRK